MLSNTPKADRTSITAAAMRICGCIWGDATDPKASLASRCRQAAAWTNLGTDGDLTDADREELLSLARTADLAAL